MTILHILAIDPGPQWMGWAHLHVEHNPGVRVSYLSGGEEQCSARAAYALVRHTHNNSTGGELIVAIESPAGYIFTPARSPQVLMTARRAGGLAWLAELEGYRVIEATAQQVRQILCGKANAQDGQVHDAVRANVFRAPSLKNSHVADACAMGLVGAWLHLGNATLPTPKPKAKKGRGGGKGAVATPT